LLLNTSDSSLFPETKESKPMSSAYWEKQMLWCKLRTVPGTQQASQTCTPNVHLLGCCGGHAPQCWLQNNPLFFSWNQMKGMKKKWTHTQLL
jgi:hypothetical protein